MSLAEIMVGLFVLACAVLGLVAAEIYLARSERGTGARQAASLTAQNLLNERLAADFDLNASRPRTALSQSLSYALQEQRTAPNLKTINLSVYFLDESAWRQYDVSTCYCNVR
jgi:Tfp pilus assembly protein PilV